MAYAELCLDMRIGLIDGNWNNGTVLCIDNELLQDPTALGHYSDMVDEAKNTQSPSSGSNTVEEKIHDFTTDGNPSLRKCLELYKALNTAILKDSQSLLRMEGFPPKSLEAQFQMVSHEMYKYDLLNRYPSAFRSGNLSGRAMELSLAKTNTDALSAVVEDTRKWHKRKKALSIPDKCKSSKFAHLCFSLLLLFCYGSDDDNDHTNLLHSLLPAAFYLYTPHFPSPSPSPSFHDLTIPLL